MSLAMSIDMAGTPLELTIDFDTFVAEVLGLNFSQQANSGLVAAVL